MTSESDEADGVSSGERPEVSAAQRELVTPHIERHLRNWQLSLSELDHRYDDKVLLIIAARAMLDDEFRVLLLRDPMRAMATFETAVPLPAHLSVRFVENTVDVLTVILPPRVRDLPAPSEELSAYLESRITKLAPVPTDDFDFVSHYGNLGDQGRNGVFGDGNVEWGGDTSSHD